MPLLFFCLDIQDIGYQTVANSLPQSIMVLNYQNLTSV